MAGDGFTRQRTPGRHRGHLPTFGKTAQAARPPSRPCGSLRLSGRPTSPGSEGTCGTCWASGSGGPGYNCVSFIALTNRRVDRAGISSILEPVSLALRQSSSCRPAFDPGRTTGAGHGIGAMLIAFLRFKPDLLTAPSSRQPDWPNSPVPRTWVIPDRQRRSARPAC